MATRRSGRANKRGRIITVDFTNVEDQKVVDEGDYPCEVVEIIQKEGDKAEYLAWRFKVVGGKFDGVTVYNNTSLSDQSLWNLRQLLECMKMEVEKKVEEIDLDELIGEKVGLTIINDDSYDGKPRNKVTGYYELGAEKEEEEEEKPARKARRDGKDEKPARKGKKLEALDSSDVAEMDEGELEDVVDKYELDVDLDDFKTTRRKANAVIDALESGGHLA